MEFSLEGVSPCWIFRFKLLLYNRHNFAYSLLFLMAKCMVMSLTWTNKKKEIKGRNLWSKEKYKRATKREAGEEETGSREWPISRAFSYGNNNKQTLQGLESGVKAWALNEHQECVNMVNVAWNGRIALWSQQLRGPRQKLAPGFLKHLKLTGHHRKTQAQANITKSAYIYIWVDIYGSFISRILFYLIKQHYKSSLRANFL